MDKKDCDAIVLTVETTHLVQQMAHVLCSEAMMEQLSKPASIKGQKKTRYVTTLHPQNRIFSAAKRTFAMANFNLVRTEIIHNSVLSMTVMVRKQTRLLACFVDTI